MNYPYELPPLKILDPALFSVESASPIYIWMGAPECEFGMLKFEMLKHRSVHSFLEHRNNEFLEIAQSIGIEGAAGYNPCFSV